MLEEKGFLIQINFLIEAGNDALYRYTDTGDKTDKHL